MSETVVSKTPCFVCGKGPPRGPSVFRVNAKGQSGIWVCWEHRNHVDKLIDPETVAAVRELEKQQWVQCPECADEIKP